MNIFWNCGKYKVISATHTETSEGRQWKVDLGIQRPWPLSWYNNPPWKKIPRRHYPIRTFIGKGYAWHEKKDSRTFAVGEELRGVLNAIVSEIALDLIPKIQH